MAGLLKKIKDLHPDVARELEKANFHSDDDIRTLTREDLHELLRGPEKLKQRKAVYELIHQQKPIGDLLKDLKSFIPAESLEAALTENGVLSGYLHIMKDLTSQVEKVHSFLQAHVSLLEEHSYDYKAAKVACTGSNAQQVSNLPPTLTGTHTGSNAKQAPHPSYVDPDEPPGAHKAQPVAEVSSSVATKQIRMTEPHFSELPTVKFRSIVSSKTLNCEHTILDRLRNQGKVTLVETEYSPELIIVFCPIMSRIDSDLESVMNKRPESLVDKPVILVMMHHAHTPNERVQKPGSVLKKWNILLVVNVFYHETMHGLLTCDMNNQAVNEMHTTLLKHCEKSICESVNDSDITMSDTCSHNSSASESFFRKAGNDNMALFAHECNAGTSSSSSYGSSCSHDNRGGRVPSVDSGPSGSHGIDRHDARAFQGNQKGMVDNVAASHSSSLSGDNDTHTSGFHGNQAGNVGNSGTLSRSNGKDGYDHSGKVDQGTIGRVKKYLWK